MAERVRKPEWLKISIGAMSAIPKQNALWNPIASIRFAAVAVAPTRENVGVKEPPPL